jgi:hypothetical protein
MWAAAGMAGRAHWSRAHRFFSHARWDPDALGLALARLVVAASTTDGQALTVAVDDTLFHRYGRSVFGAACSARRGSMMGPRRAATGSAAGTVS